MGSSRKLRLIAGLAVLAIGSAIAFAAGNNSASGVDITPTLRVGGHYQGSVKASAPVCMAPRLMKIKRVIAGPDRVVAQGTTVLNSDGTKGVFKQHRPFKKGSDDYYSQVYTYTTTGYSYGYIATPTKCLGGKSPKRELRNSPKL
jgi:hypothetical protein